LRTLDNAISAVKNGATDYITKPFELKTVHEVVEKIVKTQTRLTKKDQIFKQLKLVKYNFQYKTAELDPGIVARGIGDLLNKMQFGAKNEITQFELAFIEILQNAIEHGNLELSSMDKNRDSFSEDRFEKLKKERMNDRKYGMRTVTITFEANQDLFNFTVADEGKGYDWKKFIDKMHRVKASLTDVSGRGFKIIEHIFDEVHFNERGNVITIIKNKTDQTV
jgi:anti-sigma regulatory factor (Ser/Thr protein kinase)